MPEPGSNRYDQELARQRHRFEEQGHPDADADRLARRSMRERTRLAGPAVDSERAGGPLGGRGGKGDAGNAIELRSPAFSPNSLIPPEYTKTGDDVSPPLEWSSVPEGTAEVAVICEDPDAPGGTFRHWLLTGLRPDTTSLPKGERPPGARAWRNDFGDDGYSGPLPPMGDGPHRYFFRVFALDTELPQESDIDPDEVRTFLEEHRLAAGTLIGTFAR